jgi:hypothetical protein
MTSDEWIRAFAEELEKLRPHLQAYGGPSRLTRSLAAQAYGPTVDPVAAARAVHEHMGPPPQK